MSNLSAAMLVFTLLFIAFILITNKGLLKTMYFKFKFERTYWENQPYMGLIINSISYSKEYDTVVAECTEINLIKKVISFTLYEVHNNMCLGMEQLTEKDFDSIV